MLEARGLRSCCPIGWTYLGTRDGGTEAGTAGCCFFARALLGISEVFFFESPFPDSTLSSVEGSSLNEVSHSPLSSLWGSGVEGFPCLHLQAFLLVTSKKLGRFEIGDILKNSPKL